MDGRSPRGEVGRPSRLALPAGTVTFLLSDIEGSTRLWSRGSEAMGRAVADTYAILDRAIGAHDGVRPVEQGEGDSVVGAFSRASDALAAALEAQLEISAYEWPGGMDLRVRIALHTADAHLRDEGNYFGLALSRCARLRALARGGQTLLSRATRDLVVDALPAGVRLVDQGVVGLRDLDRAEHVYALEHPDLEDGAGPPLAGIAPAGNLPHPLTPFVGREQELGQLRDALSHTRLLTLTGAGGAGKTRLAARAAAEALDRFAGGAWWAELASVADGELVTEALADALGVRPPSTSAVFDAVRARLLELPTLVVLDNCEHVLEACADLAEALLRACPGLVVIATSRMPLGVPGEMDWRVPSMSLPEAADGEPSVDEVKTSDAVRLFAERARKARPGFAVVEQNVAAVVRICRELDGLPLAIELAAARLRMMSVEQIASALADRFHLLSDGTRRALPRQRALRASVDWSHDLLSEPERVLLRRLAVFTGGFTLDLAEDACAAPPLARTVILEVLGSIVDQSLVVAEERDGLVRYRLLETVRHYALERLVDAGEAAVMADRHRDAMIDVAEQVGPRLHSVGQRAALGVLDPEAANLAAAIDHAAETNPDGALRLVVALTFWWKLRGLFGPAQRAFASALAADTSPDSPLRARALFGRGYLAVFAGRTSTSEALADLEQARLKAEAVRDDLTLARALTVIGYTQIFVDPVGSRATSERAREIAHACGDNWSYVVSTINLAHSYVYRQEFDEAERLLDAAQSLSEALGDLEAQARLWLCRCHRPCWGADGPRLKDHAERALAFARASGDPTEGAIVEGLLAAFDDAAGRPRAALERMQTIRAQLRSTGAGLAMGWTTNWLARAQAALGDTVAARSALESAVASGGAPGGYRPAGTLVILADVLRVAGDPVAAEARAREGLLVAERVGSPLVIASAKEILGRLALDADNPSRAEALLHDALSIRLDRALHMHVPQTIDALAEIAAGAGADEAAARTLGIADRARAQRQLVRWAPDAPRVAQLEQRLREALGEEAFERAHREGGDLPFAEAVAWIRRARGPRQRPERGWDSLTPTELGVVALVVEGLTNPQIGERMFISRGTVKAHLSHIFAKLGITSRAELAAEAARRATTIEP